MPFVNEICYVQYCFIIDAFSIVVREYWYVIVCRQYESGKN